MPKISIKRKSRSFVNGAIRLAKGGYTWSKKEQPKIALAQTEDYATHGSDNQDLDSYLKGVQLLGDGISFINPLLGRGISAAGDLNDIVRNPKDLKNYITPLLPAVGTSGMTGNLIKKTNRFNNFLSIGTLVSDIPGDLEKKPIKLKH